MADRNAWKLLARWLGRQRWIRFSIRDRFARAVEHPDRTHGSSFRQAFFGGLYVGSTANFIDWSARYFGAYCREELDLFVDACGEFSDASAVIDVGANVGHHSLFYALRGAEVFSFEPNPAAMELLGRKIDANPLLRIHAFLKGLSDRADVLDLSIPDHSNLGTASLEKVVGSSSVAVEVRCGGHCDQIRLLKRVDWIKVDVEGHELRVLAGLRQVIAANHPPVFFEWNGGNRFAEALALFPENYSFYRFLGVRIFAIVLAWPGYQLQPLSDAKDPGLSNVLAWPPRPMPACLSRRICR